MAQTGSLPWLLLAGLVAIMVAIFVDDVLLNPLFTEFTALAGWRGSDLEAANDSMRMVGDWVRNLLVIIIFSVSFGVVLEARRGA